MKQDDNRMATLIGNLAPDSMAQFESKQGAGPRHQCSLDRRDTLRHGRELGAAPRMSTANARVLGLDLDTFGPRVQHRTATREVDAGLHQHVHGSHVALDVGALSHLE